MLAQDGKWSQFRVKAQPFNEAADSFLAWAEGEYKKRNTFLRIRSSFTSLREFFGLAQMAAITPGKIEDYKTFRRTAGVMEVSIRHDLHNLSLLFQYAEKQSWVRSNMTRKVKIPSDAESVRMNILTPNQERRYFEACLWMDKALPFRAAGFSHIGDEPGYRDLNDFGRLMIQQGCRPEELLELRKDSIDLMNRWLYIKSGKTKAARRRLKLTAECASILARRLAGEGPFIFPSPRNAQRHRAAHWRVHAEVLEASGLAFVPYDFRHTFATRAAADGMPLPVLAATLGHANLRSVMKYVHITADHIDEGMLRLEQVRLERLLAEQVKSVAGFLPVHPAGTAQNEDKPGTNYSGRAVVRKDRTTE